MIRKVLHLISEERETNSYFIPINLLKISTKGFDCDKEPINNFLKLYAAKNMANKLSTTFVLPYRETPEAKKGRIAAFYTLANSTIARDELPEAKLPRYPVPIILLAQLGVHNAFQGQRLGEKTLIYALRHAFSVITNDDGIPSYGVVLDVLDEDAKKFYQRFEYFIEIAELKLFVPLSELELL